MEPASPFQHLQFPAELACEFFAVFSRFEFSLKENHYFRAGRRGAAEPNWDRFASDIAECFDAGQDGTTVDAVAYLIDAPPSRQVVENNAVTWRDTVFNVNDSKAQKALLAVRLVRNNLFHGGKHSPHSPPGRDEKLVRAAIAVLKHCLTLDQELRTDYENSAF